MRYAAGWLATLRHSPSGTGKAAVTLGVASCRHPFDRRRAPEQSRVEQDPFCDRRDGMSDETPVAVHATRLSQDGVGADGPEVWGVDTEGEKE